jgi:predicted enzyme related to lactoylglutathione lyase
MFYVGVDDVEAALAKAESLGGSRVFGPMEVPDGPTIGHFADPEGNVVGLFARM